jgi:hypothetical protein
VRCVPEHVDPVFDGWWSDLAVLHPGWEMVTYADPIDPDDWPLTGHRHAECVAGAQLAGLIRLEDVYQRGGFYVDADVRPLRSFDPLRRYGCVAGFEDETWIADAVFGAEAHHPAIGAALSRALGMSMSEGPGATGPQSFTKALVGRTDVTLLPPSAFYPCFYTAKDECAGITAETHPDSYCVHVWAFSWAAPNG